MHPAIRRAACALTVSISVSAHAQSQDEAAVIVSATRFEEPLTAASSIDKTVIQGAELRNAGVRSVAEAIERFGNVQVRNDFTGAGNRSIDARGFGDTAAQNTLILLDGVRISENELTNAFTAGIPVDRIERIEILRGGAGAVVYGEGATGATINIVTRGVRAGEVSGHARAIVGSLDTREAHAGGRFANERLAFFVDGSRRLTDNYRDNNEVNTTALTAGGRVFLSAGEIGFTVTDESIRARLPGSLTVAQFRADPRQTFTPNDWSNADIQRRLAYATWRLGEVDLRLDWSDTDRLSRAFTWGSLSQIEADNQVVSPRLRWRPSDGLFEVVAGADFTDWESRRGDNNFFTPSINRANQQGKAGYLQGILNLGRTRLEAGLRHETFEKRNDHATPAFVYSQTQSIRPWSLAARHDFGAAAIFARVGRSDRVPNVDENNARIDATLLPIQRSKDIEFGGTVRYRDLSATARLFRHTLNNEVSFDMVAPACFGPGCFFGGANRSLSPTRRSGLELEGRWKVVEQFSLFLQYTNLRARFLNGSLGGLSVSGNELPMVPRQRLGLRGVWEPVAAHRIELAYQRVSSQRYSGDYNNLLNERIPAYDLWDLGYRYRFNSGDVGLTARNLTDRKYYSIGFGGAGPFGGVYSEPGRTLMADVNLRF